jgi:hypothetical protein
LIKGASAIWRALQRRDWIWDAVPARCRFREYRRRARSTGLAAIYTDHIKAAHVIRKVILRQLAILNFLYPF